ncbi:TPA: hypothetical protein DD449_05400 [Candidatus Berkelbacteria bacterium]|uniref:Uncharacterized protein n=1 Tax=Berkelbacteria bacterium GW2011_GWE1_39_12 TaxID=1618337 RepID=A0A0G4B305_9BACT|nr:MAG: hypothetical protein UT28_C0001G0153 [Berkelbacteria bacterium GW2011_GWE1_39_12]HBO61079.1 hypothetical protein [Candidatus Berkelbacteria bacterium]
MITYFSWWYYDEPLYLWRSIKIITKKFLSSFSIAVLLRTLFDPWKKDVVYLENASLDARFKAMVDNLFSRCIGFVVRIFTILIGLALTTIVFVLLTIGFIVWLLMPAIILVLIISGMRTIQNGV